MTATRMGSPSTRTGIQPCPGSLANVLDSRRRDLDLSVAEVARRAAMPLSTTQRRFRDATDATHGELVRIAGALDAPLADLIAQHERATEGADILAAPVPVAS